MQAPEVTGHVAAIVDGPDSLQADIVIDTSVSCARCREGRGCGAGLLNGRSERIVRVRVPSGMALVVGDTVSLAVSARTLLNAATIAYGFPLAGILIGALGAGLLVPGDLAAISGALLGLLAGAGLARRRAGGVCPGQETAELLRLGGGLRP